MHWAVGVALAALAVCLACALLNAPRGADRGVAARGERLRAAQRRHRELEDRRRAAERAAAAAAPPPPAGAATPATEVRPGLWLGDRWNAADARFLAAAGIRRVVNVTRASPAAPGVEEFLRLPVDDDPAENLVMLLPKAVAFLRAGAGRPALVHCEQGVSRSATVVAAYLAAAEGLSAEAALADLVARRPVVAPNGGFVEQLGEFVSGI